MPSPTGSMVREHQRSEELDTSLHSNRQASERSSEGCRVEVPAEKGGDEVCCCEDVEAACHERAGDTMQTGTDPADLWAVDGQVRRDGARETLFGEDGGFLAGDGFGVGSCCCGGSVKRKEEKKNVRDLANKWENCI